MITQLRPTVWLETPKGVGLCHFVIDYGEEHDLLWVVADDATGEIWTWPNPRVKLIKNVSLDALRERRDGPGHSCPPLPSASEVSTLLTPSARFARSAVKKPSQSLLRRIWSYLA